MADTGLRELTWSIRHGARGGYAHRVLGEVAGSCLAICRTHLPDESGYEIARTCLSGPLEGVSLRIQRGTFRATISVQHFERLHRPGDAADEGRTLRLVAASTHSTPPDVEAQTRTAAYWTATGGATGTMAVGIVALALAGAITAWGSVLLLVPAVFGTRLCMAMWMANAMRQRSLGPAPPEDAALHACSQAEARDLARWSTVLGELEAQQHAAAQRFSRRPFRGVSSGSHAAITA